MCSGNGTCTPDDGGSTGTGTGGQVGGALVGPTDNHCWGPGPVDGGSTFQFQDTNPNSCQVTDGGPDFNEDAGAPGPEYGPTNYNTAANDDDCKYFTSWRSTPISKGADVTFWFTTLYATNGTPVTGMVGTPDGGPAVPSCIGEEASQVYFEVSGDPDGGLANHPSPFIAGDYPVTETPPGSGIYQFGPAAFFDESGLWYVRFHFNENCCDVLPDAPHGHAAFYVNVP